MEFLEDEYYSQSKSENIKYKHMDITHLIRVLKNRASDNEDILMENGRLQNKIEQLTSDESSAQNMNQLVRWINTKEEHATFIQSIIADYFLAQRIKHKKNNEPGRQQYVDQTLLLQQIIVAAMKSKQSIDKSGPESVSILLNQFVELYFDEHGKNHLNTLQKG